MSSLNRIEQKTLVAEATEQIQSYILKNDLRTLPGEIQLISLLGISRSVVREALSRLQHVGLIETRKKRGIVVKEANPIKIFDEYMPFIMKDSKKRNDMAYFRYILESGAIEFVVENGHKEDLKKIKEAALRYKSTAEKNSSHRTLHLADMKFHTSILNASGNTFLLQMNSVIAKHFATHGLAPHENSHFREVAGTHLEIADAIIAGETRKAQQLMKKHLHLI